MIVGNLKVKLSIFDVPIFAARLYGRTWKKEQLDKFEKFASICKGSSDDIYWFYDCEYRNYAEEGFMLVNKEGVATYKLITEQIFGE